MAHYTYVVLSTGVAGREAEFQQWYKDQHLDDIARLPGVVSARLLFPDLQMSEGTEIPQFSALALYELETDEPKATVDAMFAKAGTDEMRLTDAMDMTRMVQLIAHDERTIG